MTGKYGFEDNELNIDGLIAPTDRRVPDGIKKKFIKSAENLGYKDRNPKENPNKKTTHRKAGRKPPKEPKIQILISGPESIINSFKEYCENNDNLPYWKAIERFLNSEE